MRLNFHSFASRMGKPNSYANKKIYDRRNQIWKPVNWWRWSRHVHIKRMCQFGVAAFFFFFSSLTLSSFSISIEILGVFLFVRIKCDWMNWIKFFVLKSLPCPSLNILNKQNSMIDSLLLSSFFRHRRRRLSRAHSMCLRRVYLPRNDISIIIFNFYCIISSTRFDSSSVT